MATNPIEGLFSSAEDIRRAQQKSIQEQGLTAAAMLTRGAPGASSALPGLLQSFGANIAANIPADAQNLVKRGLGGAGSIAGAMGRPDAQLVMQQATQSPEERQAQMMKAKIREAKGSYEGLKALGQELMNNGQIKEAYGVFQMAEKIKPETVEDTSMDTNDIKNIMFYAKNELKCDVNDPNCIRRARDIYIETKRADTGQQQMEVFGYKGLVQKRDDATAAKRSMETINESLRTLDSGDVNIGSFANTRQGAMKLASSIFGWQEGQETVDRTATLMAQTKALAGELLASGMFGSGTGISERDLITAQEMAGASETLTPTSMKQILEYNAKMQAAKIRSYNQRLNSYSGEFYARTPEGSQDAFFVNTPEVYQTQNVGVSKEDKPDFNKAPVFEGDMMFMVPIGAQVGTYKGTRGYMFGGKFYDFEGKEVN